MELVIGGFSFTKKVVIESSLEKGLDQPTLRNPGIFWGFSPYIQVG